MSTATQNRTGGLLVLHALAPLHPGTGAAVHVIDLPIQRERHTNWPMIAGSSVKGVLRDACNLAKDDKAVVFGPDTANASEHSGSLSVSDARLLAFPVRSLKGVFAWVTCPSAVERLRRDARFVGLTPPPSAPEVSPGKALVPAGSGLLIDAPQGKSLVLEEFDYPATGELPAEFTNWFAENLLRGGEENEFARARLRSHLVVVSDDDFTWLVQHATSVEARIKLEENTKTVAKGALFYQEMLPAESILYAVVLSENSRKSGDTSSAAQLAALLAESLPSVLQIGGDESIGRGFCAVRLTT